jgi:hypothetical protein
MKKRSVFIFAFATLWAVGMHAQVTIGTLDTPQDFSILELISNNTRGLRLPQLTQTQRDTLDGTVASTGGSAAMIAAAAAFNAERTGKAEGLQIFNTTSLCVETWNGTVWIQTCFGGGGTPTPVPALTTTSYTFCQSEGKTVGDLSTAGATGTVNWYSASTGGSALAASTALATDTYYASQTVAGVESTTRTAVGVTVNSTPVLTNMTVDASTLSIQDKTVVGATNQFPTTKARVNNISGVTYTWTVGCGLEIVSGQGTYEITVKAKKVVGDGGLSTVPAYSADSIKVTATNSCGSDTKNMGAQTLTVTPVSGICGANTVNCEWLQFMCYNLGAVNQTTSINTMITDMGATSQFYGEFYQWGKKLAWPTCDLTVAGYSDAASAGATEAGYNLDDTAWGDGSVKNNTFDPCPTGFRVPSIAQYQSLANGNANNFIVSEYSPVNTASGNAWSAFLHGGTLGSPCKGIRIGNYLFLPLASIRGNDGGLYEPCNYQAWCHYHTSTADPVPYMGRYYSYQFAFDATTAYMNWNGDRWSGCVIRCVAE